MLLRTDLTNCLHATMCGHDILAVKADATAVDVKAIEQLRGLIPLVCYSHALLNAQSRTGAYRFFIGIWELEGPGATRL